MLEPGARLQRGYVIERVLGQGGMGAVYLARQDTLGGRRVAIKETTLRVDDAHAQALVDEQFHREAQILASIDHPNLVDVKDYFHEGGSHYLVMSFIDGETLEAVLAQSPGPLPTDRVLGWMDQLCAVLTVLHEHDPQVLVRDLKPSNVMVDGRDRVRLIDFGIARIEDRSGARTSTLLKGAGTVGFAPVEQFGGGGTDARSDIYALGATLYTLLTRTLPPWSMHIAAGEAALTPPGRLNPAVSPQLEAVIMRMMALRRDQRFQTVREVRQALLDAGRAAPAFSGGQRFCTQCGGTLVAGQGCPQCGASAGGSGGWPAPPAGGSGGWPAPPAGGSGGWPAPPAGGSGGWPAPPAGGSGGWPAPPAGGSGGWPAPPAGGSGGWPAPPAGGSGGWTVPAGGSGGWSPPPGPDIGARPARRGGIGPLVGVVVVLVGLVAGGWYVFEGPRPAPSAASPVASGPPQSPTASPTASPTMAVPTPQPTPEPKIALDGCGANLTVIGSAAELFRADNGAYPGSLQMLVPRYLKEIPTCPAAEEATYGYIHDEKATAYTVTCEGWSHKLAGIGRNHPLFDSWNGMRTRNPNLDLSPRTAQQYGDKGQAAWEMGQYEEAIGLYEQAASLDPRWAWPQYMIGQCRMAQDDFHRAIDAYTLAIGLRSAALFHNARGRAYNQLADNESALRDFFEADKLQGKDPDTYANVAFTLYKLGRFDDALKIAGGLRNLDPQASDVYVVRYWCELAKGDGAQAAGDAQGHLGMVGWRSYQSPYSVIVAWLGLTMQKRTAEARGVVESGLGRLRGEWPYPCVQYLAGVVGEDAMLAQATDVPKQTEAHCYAGLRAAIEGRTADARRHLEWVRDRGHKPYFEYRAALSWLTRL